MDNNSRKNDFDKNSRKNDFDEEQELKDIASSIDKELESIERLERSGIISGEKKSIAPDSTATQETQTDFKFLRRLAETHPEIINDYVFENEANGFIDSGNLVEKILEDCKTTRRYIEETSRRNNGKYDKYSYIETTKSDILKKIEKQFDKDLDKVIQGTYCLHLFKRIPLKYLDKTQKEKQESEHIINTVVYSFSIAKIGIIIPKEQLKILIKIFEEVHEKLVDYTYPKFVTYFRRRLNNELNMRRVQDDVIKQIKSLLKSTTFDNLYHENDVEYPLDEILDDFYTHDGLYNFLNFKSFPQLFMRDSGIPMLRFYNGQFFTENNFSYNNIVERIKNRISCILSMFNKLYQLKFDREEKINEIIDSKTLLGGSPTEKKTHCKIQKTKTQKNKKKQKENKTNKLKTTRHK